MEPERILLPLDIRRCPLEIFSLAEGFSKRRGITLILLHVVHLNIVAPDKGVYEELELEAREYLERLAEQFLHPVTSAVVHVRFGSIAKEILKEAKSENVELIILPTYGPSFWSRLVTVWKPGTCRMVSPLAERIVRDSTCGVFIASVKSRFNCEKEWARVTEKDGRRLCGVLTNSSQSKGREENQFAHSRSNGSL